MRGQQDASGTGVQIHARQIARTVRVGACDQVFADRQADKVQRAAPVGGHRAFLGQGHAGQRLGAGMHPVAEDHRLFGGQPVGCGVRPRQALSADRGDPMTAGLHAAGQGGACRSVIACQSVQDQRQRQGRVDGARSVRPVPDQPADARQARYHRRIGQDLQPAAGDRDQIAPAAQLAPVADQQRAQAGQIGDALRVGRRARIGQGAGPRTCLVRMTGSQQARVGKGHLRLGVRPWAVGSRGWQMLARRGLLLFIIYVKYIP